MPSPHPREDSEHRGWLRVGSCSFWACLPFRGHPRPKSETEFGIGLILPGQFLPLFLWSLTLNFFQIDPPGGGGPEGLGPPEGPPPWALDGC